MFGLLDVLNTRSALTNLRIGADLDGKSRFSTDTSSGQKSRLSESVEFAAVVYQDCSVLTNRDHFPSPPFLSKPRQIPQRDTKLHAASNLLSRPPRNHGIPAHWLCP